jgi:hypothetical protein
MREMFCNAGRASFCMNRITVPTLRDTWTGFGFVTCRVLPYGASSIPTNSTGLLPSSEAASRSATQEFPHFMEPEGSLPSSQKPASGSHLETH